VGAECGPIGHVEVNDGGLRGGGVKDGGVEHSFCC
jgi:hypothetical protein